jgi:hypothetical protein
VGLVAAVGMRQKLRHNEAALEAALHHDLLALGDDGTALALRSELDQGPAGVVLQDELVAEDLGDAALHGDHVVRLHLVDGGGREQHDRLRRRRWWRRLGEGGGTTSEKNESDSRE